MADLWLTVKQAARELGIAERTCRKWLAEGRLEGRRFRIGNRLLWRVSAESAARLRPEKTAESGAESAAQGAALETAKALVAEVRSLREENAEYRRVIELQAQALARVQERLAALEEAVTRALPPAREEPEPKRPWWRKLLGLKGE